MTLSTFYSKYSKKILLESLSFQLETGSFLFSVFYGEKVKNPSLGSGGERNWLVLSGGRGSKHRKGKELDHQSSQPP